MAPVPEAYFASLDKCFSGDAQLLSLKRVFLYLCDPERHPDDAGSAQQFLWHPESIRLLSHSLAPFAPPSAKSKSEFESKTAAINVETSPQAPYNLDEIKSDALWLSEHAGIDEVTALRITVLEWQSRPNARLLGRFSAEEATSLQDATSVDSFRVSLAGPQVMDILKKTTTGGADSAEFSSEKARRLRLRHIYLSERSHILKTARKLLSLSLRDKIPSDAGRIPVPSRGKETEREHGLRRLGETIFKNNTSEDESNRFLEDCVKAVQTRIADFQSGGGWLSAAESDAETEATWRTTLIDEIAHIMQIMFLQLQSSDTIPTGALLLSWLRLMADCSFLESLSIPCEDPLTLMLALQALASVTTLSFLKLPVSLAFVWKNASLSQSEVPSKSRPYFLSREHIAEINEIFLNCVSMGVVTASPAVFAWGTILHSMRDIALSAKETREMEQFQNAVDSFQSNTPSASPVRGSEQTLCEELLDLARIPAYGDDFVAILTSGAIERGQVFEVIINLASKLGTISAIDDVVTSLWIRSSLLGLVRVSSVYMDYSPELVEAALAILNGSSTDSLRGRDDSISYPSDPRYVFLRDNELMDRIFRISRSRFPYESVPFLKLCRALTGKDQVGEDGILAILSELENMETFTQVVSPDFQGYETIREEENANYVSLIEPIPMIAPASKKLKTSPSAENALVVTVGSQIQPATTGQVVSESKPAVIMWYHQYSCLSFLGSWLEKWAESGGNSPDADEDTIAEIVGLLTDLMASAQSGNPHDEDEYGPKRILELASDGLASRGDVVSVVLDILERSLQNVGIQAGARSPLELSIACLQFVSVLMTILPNRVWPFLSRSSLLGSGGQGGRMTAIVAASEVTSGDYPFLLSCIHLFDAVVEDAISHAAIRRISNRVTSRASSVADWSAGVPSHVMRNVLLNFVRTMVEIYNSDANWRFNEHEQKLQIEAVLASNFEKILYYAYGIDETEDSESKITGIFSASASYVLDVLRPASKDELPFNPVLRIIIDGLQTPTSTMYLRRLLFIERQLKSTLKLAIKLIQAAQLVGSSVSLLEDQLFKAAPVLAKLYCCHDRYCLPVVTLLDLLVTRAAGDSENEPPSLLGHLGAESACLFLDVLAQFDRPLNDSRLFTSIWRLLSTFVSKRQQWLAVYLLTGSSPRESLKQKDGKKAPAMRGTPFLKTALDTLSNIEQTDPAVSLALLEFVSLSQEHWPWATPQLGRHPNFFNAVIHYVAHLKIGGQSPTAQIYLTQIAAITADLCAVYLHSAKEARDQSFFKTLIPLVSWFAENGVDVSGYNASLHANLKKNFEMKYSGCKLQNFKRTALEKRPLGKDYYYDMYLAEKLLSFDFAWSGKKNQGFAEEFERANVNLSLVEAQVNLFHSWKFFALEHSTDFMPDREVQRSMALVVRNCLTANSRSVPQEAIFNRLQQSRVDFALALLQRLVEVGSRGSEVFSLLEVVWDAIRARGTTYEDALIHDDTEYYRSLLNVLFLALQFHVAGPSRAAPEAVSKKPELSSDLSIIVEVVKVVIAQGFKSLTTYLHDEPHKCSPKDFAILTAILQTALRVKNAERIYEHIVFHIEDNDVARYACTLFSWADQLTVEGDPIYGELSIIFLVELSTIPMLAEHLAVEAVLMKLSTSRLTRVLGQPRGCGPFDAVPRLYAIWTGGFLPLCLNLLYHVNRAAPEVAAFLNQFEGQLSRAAEAFVGVHAPVASTQSAKKICLAMASEASSLALISFILQRYREAGASTGVDGQAIQELKWDKGQLKDDIEELLGRRPSLQARIVATNEKELEMARQKPVNAASGAESRLEERIVEELTAALTCLSGGEEAA